MSQSKRATPQLIGGFVIGAVALAFAGVMFFGSGGLFAEKETYVLYFDGSVKGLNVGAPVMFRGVKIGTVTDVSVYVNPKDFTFRIPVLIEVETKRIESAGAEKNPIKFLDKLNQDDSLKLLIEKGLRAQLQMQSIVTGQLFVQLDMLPDEPVKLSGYPSEFKELPTITSGLQELSATFEKLPLEDVAQKLLNTLEGLEELVHSPELATSLYNLDKTMKNLTQLTITLNQSLPKMIDQTDSAMTSVKLAADNFEQEINPLTKDVRASLATLQETLQQVDQTAASLDRTIAEDSPLRYRVDKALDDFSKAARSVRTLTDELERHPESMLLGKRRGGDE
jgi:paraquat-inducible protein B